MSQHRINPNAGYAKPNGKCRWCQKDGLGPRSTFCSDACIHEWKLRSQPGYVRRHVEHRDKGVCAACGLDTEALRKEAGGKWTKSREMEARLMSLGFKVTAVHSGDYWQADHIVEVVKGGGGCGLEGYMTLCTPCHKAKTKRLAQELAERRRLEKELANQPLFPEDPNA